MSNMHLVTNASQVSQIRSLYYLSVAIMIGSRDVTFNLNLQPQHSCYLDSLITTVIKSEMIALHLYVSKAHAFPLYNYNIRDIGYCILTCDIFLSHLVWIPLSQIFNIFLSKLHLLYNNWTVKTHIWTIQIGIFYFYSDTLYYNGWYIHNTTTH